LFFFGYLGNEVLLVVSFFGYTPFQNERERRAGEEKMHARYYRQRLGKNPSEVIKGFVVELERMVGLMPDLQGLSELHAQIAGMDDLRLAVEEQENEIEDEGGMTAIRDLLIGHLRPPHGGVSTLELLRRFVAQDEDAPGDTSALEEELATLKALLAESAKVLTDQALRTKTDAEVFAELVLRTKTDTGVLAELALRITREIEE
jgi:hypothetical protein